MPDVLKILKDLEYKSVGIEPDSKKMPEGFFVSFRPIGLPVHDEDFRNPWTPTAANLKEILSSLPKPDAPPAASVTDAGAVAPPLASAKLDRDKLIAAGVGESIRNYGNTFMLTDDKIVLSDDYRAMPQCGHVSDAWYAIINGANGIPSEMELNDDIKKALDEAKAVLMDKDSNPTPHYEAYTKFEDEYRDAVKERNRQFANVLSDPTKFQMWPIDGKVYQDQVDEALDKWVGFGFKTEIEKAIATLAAQGIDPAILLITRAKHKYENSLVNIPGIPEPVPYTWMNPSKWYSSNAGGWNAYTQTDMHNEVHHDSSSSVSEAGGGVNLGFFSIGGGGSVSTERTSMDIKTTNLTVDFEYSIVDIVRPWLDTTLLNLSNWFLVGDYPASCISDGTYGQEMTVNRPNVMLFMPSIVTSLILVRNLNITFDEYAAHADTFSKTVEGGGSIGWGPFCVHAHHKEKHDSDNFVEDRHGEGISVEGVQIIGYVSTIMPASPKKASKEFMQKKQSPAIPVSPSAPTSQPTTPAPVTPP